MNALQFNALLPYTLLAAASMVVILLIAFRQSHTVIRVVGFVLMCAEIAALLKVKRLLPVAILPLFQIDGFALLFPALIVFCALIFGLVSCLHVCDRKENPKEYYLLL